MRTPRHLVALLPLLAATAVAGCSSSSDDTANIPVLESGNLKEVCCASIVEGSGTQVHLPAGILDLTATEVGERFEDDTPDLDVDDVLAGEDAVLVDIAWDLGFVSAYPSEIKEILDDRTTSDYLGDWDAGLLELAVTAGDERVELPDPSLNDRALVALPATEDIAVEITYDGLTQTLSVSEPALDEGRARELRKLVVEAGSGKRYGEDRDWLDGPSCKVGFTRVDQGLDPSISCHTSLAAVVPYVAHQGWAPEGSSFVVVDLDHSVRHPYWVEGEAASDYRVTRQSWSATLAGEEPVATSRATYGGERLVFLVTTGSRLRLEVTGDVQFARKGAGVGPARTSHHVEERLALVAFP